MKRKLNCILLIDDDEPTNYLNNRIIERLDCSQHTQVFQSGRAALDYLSQCAQYDNDLPRPELILLDINMPAMDGWGFLEELQKLEHGQESKAVVVMLTTSINPDDQERAKTIPRISRFNSKPLTASGLTEILQEYFTDYC